MNINIFYFFILTNTCIEFQVPSDMSKIISIPDPHIPTLIKSVSLLQFEMGANVNSVNGGRTSLNGDDTKLQCKAEMFDLYSEVSEELVIQTTQPRYSPSNQDTLRTINVSSGGKCCEKKPSFFMI